MKKFKTVFDFELKEMFKSKAMIITTIVISLVVFILTSIPSIMLLFDSDDEVQVDDSQDEEIVDVSEELGVVYDNEALEETYEPFLGKATYANESELKSAVENEDIDSGFVLHDAFDYSFISYDRSAFSQEQMVFESRLSEINQNLMFEQEGIDADKVREIMVQPIESEVITLGKDASSGMFIGFAVLFIMYMLILLYGQSVATSVAREKDSRTMELLITSTKPKTLILGKVFASGVMGVLQVLTIMLSLGLGFLVNKGNYPPEILSLIQGSLTFDTLLVYILFSVSGYILYLFIFASLGSLVSKVEDVSSAITPITFLFILAYLAATVAMQSPDSSLTRITSFIPFISVFTMPIR